MGRGDPLEFELGSPPVNTRAVTPVISASRLHRHKAAAVGLSLTLVAGAAAAQDPDPNRAAVDAVCGRCHGAAQFMDKPRSWERWNDVFNEMTRIGASGTEQQLEQVTTYFLDYLTTLSVNTATSEELAWVLNVSEEVAQNIITRRQQQPFKDLAQLGAVPGVKRDRLERLRTRILF